MSAYLRRLLPGGIKAINMLVLFSMLMTNGIGVPTVKAAGQGPDSNPSRSNPAHVASYQAPKFTHPSPRIGRSQDGSLVVMTPSTGTSGRSRLSNAVISSSDDSGSTATPSLSPTPT